MDSTLIENMDEETNIEPESETFELKINPPKHFATGNIPKSHMRVQLPNSPPKKVLHEILGLGDFVKTHPFGQMGHILKGTKSHEYRFSRDNGNILPGSTFWILTNPGGPSTPPRSNTSSHRNIVLKQCYPTMLNKGI